MQNKKNIFFFGFAVSVFSISSFAQTSVLKYNLNEWVNRPTPAIQLKLDALSPVYGDVKNTASFPQEWSALQMSAGGGDPVKMAQFRNAVAADQFVSDYLGCPVVSNPLIEVQTFQKPYMVRQGDYQGWINTYGSKKDLAPAKGLASNPNRLNLICPLTANLNQLKLTSGYSVKGLGSSTQTDSVEMLIDNSLNPWRWSGPMNIVHHVEQPSMAMIIKAASPTAAQKAGNILTAYANGGPAPSQRIYLDYTIELSVEDQRALLGEFNVDQYLAGTPGTDLLSKTKAITYGPLIPYPTEWRGYYQKRVFEPSVQLSLMVNFREDGIAWLEQEFMLATLNYQRDTTYTQSPNTAMNQYIYEGGSNDGGASWYRLKLNAITDVPGILPLGPKQIYKGGNGHWEIPAYQNSSNTLWGSIDLTEFVRVAKAHQFLPGDKPVPSVPNEKQWDRLSLNWAGVIFEAHGPFKTKVKVRTFNISYR